MSLERKGRDYGREGTKKGEAEQGLALVPAAPEDPSTQDFDGQEWCLKTLRAYPGSDKSIAVPPPSLANLYQGLLEREAQGRGGMLAAAEWLLALVERYASEHADGMSVMGIEKFLRTGYVQQGKGGGASRVDGEGEGTWLVDTDSGERVWLPKRAA